MAINEYVKRISEIDLEVKLLEKHLKSYPSVQKDQVEDKGIKAEKSEVQQRIDVLKREKDQLAEAIKK